MTVHPCDSNVPENHCRGAAEYLLWTKHAVSWEEGDLDGARADWGVFQEWADDVDSSLALCLACGGDSRMNWTEKRRAHNAKDLQMLAGHQVQHEAGLPSSNAMKTQR